MAAELRHTYADVDGVRLHWAELGEASERPALVLLHGLTDSHLTWRPVAGELARDRLVWMPDLPGCGLSGRPNASYELQWHAHIIARALQQRGLDKVDVVGHSFGGGVAAMLLLECPERIRRIVLVAAGGLGRDVGFWLKFATFPHFVERYGQPFMAFGTRRAMSAVRDERGRADVDELSAMNAVGGTARAFSRSVRDVIDFRGQRRLFLHRAHEVAAFPPMAVLWGERDTLIPVAHGRAFCERMQGVTFQSFPDCGHYVHRDDPAGFVAAVRGFLEDADAKPARLRPALAANTALTRARDVLAAIVRGFKREGLES